MKKILLITALAISNLMMAKTITVDNNNATKKVAMFDDLQDAIDFAEAGDIIMIKGSATSYEEITLNKQLTLIGEGHKNSITTRVTYVKSLRFTDEGSNSIIRSIQLTNGFPGNYLYATNIKFFSVFFTEGSGPVYRSIQGQFWEFINCDFNFSSLDTQSYNAIFRNCKINALKQKNASSGIIQLFNCVVTEYINSSQFATFTNCILPLSNSNQVSSINYTTNNVFNHCMFQNNIITADTLTKLGNSVNDCVFNTDPLFVDAVDYQLQVESPAKSAGSDGTDLGITGGLYPVTKLNGANNLTVVDKVFVETTVITPGSTLKLKVSAHQKVEGE